MCIAANWTGTGNFLGKTTTDGVAISMKSSNLETLVFHKSTAVTSSLLPLSLSFLPYASTTCARGAYLALRDDDPLNLQTGRVHDRCGDCREVAHIAKVQLHDFLGLAYQPQNHNHELNRKVELYGEQASISALHTLEKVDQKEADGKTPSSPDIHRWAATFVNLAKILRAKKREVLVDASLRITQKCNMSAKTAIFKRTRCKRRQI